MPSVLPSPGQWLQIGPKVNHWPGEGTVRPVRAGVRRSVVALLAVGCCAPLLAGCAGSDGGGALGAERLIAGWPASAGSLDLAPGADSYVNAVRAAYSSAKDVQVRSLTDSGGVLSRVLGAGARTPDVVFVGVADGLPADTDAAALHDTVLRGVLDGAGVARARAADATGTATFTGADGLAGGVLDSGAGSSARATWCAFVAHGVGVVVLGSTLTQAQDETLARELRA